MVNVVTPAISGNRAQVPSFTISQALHPVRIRPEVEHRAVCKAFGESIPSYNAGLAETGATSGKEASFPWWACEFPVPRGPGGSGAWCGHGAISRIRNSIEVPSGSDGRTKPSRCTEPGSLHLDAAHCFSLNCFLIPRFSDSFDSAGRSGCGTRRGPELSWRDWLSNS